MEEIRHNPMETYPYRNVKMVKLLKSDQQFIIGAPPEGLSRKGFAQVAQVSPTSSRVTTISSDLDQRWLAPTSLSYPFSQQQVRANHIP